VAKSKHPITVPREERAMLVVEEPARNERAVEPQDRSLNVAEGVRDDDLQIS
jgi:hypothetical protein